MTDSYDSNILLLNILILLSRLSILQMCPQWLIAPCYVRCSLVLGLRTFLICTQLGAIVYWHLVDISMILMLDLKRLSLK